MQAGHFCQIWAGEKVSNYCWQQINGRPIADAIGEGKQGQADETHFDRPSKEQHAERNMKRAQSSLASEPVRSMAEHQPAGERPEAEDRDQPCGIPRGHPCANSVRDHMNDRDEKDERREKPGRIEPSKVWIAGELRK